MVELLGCVADFIIFIELEKDLQATNLFIAFCREFT